MAAPQGRVGDFHSTPALTDAELRGLLLDCLKLWDMVGRVTVREAGVAIETPEGVFTVCRADPDLQPIRWFYQTPARAAAGRAARAAPSIVALLSGLRNAMGGTGGDRLRVGSD